MRVDLHVHTEYSNDCRLKLEEIIDTVSLGKVDALAITDHNEIEGALKLKEIASFPVIVGEEIQTIDGEIIGLFLRERITPGLSSYETVRRIKAQEGLVMIPHPYDRCRSSAIDRKALMSILDHIDIIEVFNARNVFPRDNERANKLAVNRQLLRAAGSDAHTKQEIGNAYVEMEPFTDAKDFVRNLQSAAIVGKRSPLFCHLATKTVKLRNF